MDRKQKRKHCKKMRHNHNREWNNRNFRLKQGRYAEPVQDKKITSVMLGVALINLVLLAIIIYVVMGITTGNWSWG